MNRRTPQRSGSLRAATQLFLVLFLFALCGVASAQTRTSLAIASFQGKDPTYFYLDFADAKEFASRIARSELLRTAIDFEPEFETVRNMLRNFPADALSLAVSDNDESDVAFQMAMHVRQADASLLAKVSNGAATDAEIAAILGLPANYGDWLRIRTPAEGEGRYYWVRPFGLYLTAKDDILVFGSTEEAVDRSLAALKNRFHRFAPRRAGTGDNFLLARMGEELTGLFTASMGYLPDDAAPGTSGAATAEAVFGLVPGGWDVELFTNLVDIMYGKDFFDKIFVKPAGTFHRAGGGKLVAAADSTPNLKYLFSGQYGRVVGSLVAEAMDGIETSLEEELGEEKAKRLLDSLLNVDRFNVAVTSTEDRPADLRAYVYVSSQQQGALQDAADTLEKLIDEHNQGAAGEKKLKKSDHPQWPLVYSIDLPEDMAFADGANTLVLAMGEERMLAGLLPLSSLSQPFAVDSDLYEELTEANDLMETFYIDMRFMRSVVAGFLDKGIDISRSDRRMLFTLLFPFVDFREISAKTYSTEHFRLSFRTGWLDFDGRALMQNLSR